MAKHRGVFVFLGLPAALVFVVSMLVACGSDKGGSTTTLTSTAQAASSSSSAKGAATMSETIGTSTDIANGAIPAGYAAGVGAGVNTDDIADVDPRLRNVVDKMVGVLQKTGAKSARSQVSAFKASAFKALSTAPSITVVGWPCDNGQGTFDATAEISSSGTSTTWALAVTFHHCKSDTDNDIVNGTLTAVHTKDTANNYERALVNADLTSTAYDISSAITGTFVLDGSFEGIRSGSTGTNSALGSFTWMDPGANGNTVYSFTYGTGGVAVTDVWSTATGAAGTTKTHTGNGTYTLAIAGPDGSLSLAVALAGLEYKILKYTGGAKDEWLNGAVNLTWNPDLSQWGCLAGTYTFTTAEDKAVHTPFLSACPTSGTLQVNNATIEYGKPSGTKVTVTVGTISETFNSCRDMGRGLCR